MSDYLFWAVIYGTTMTGLAGYAFGKLAGMKRR